MSSSTCQHLFRFSGKRDERDVCERCGLTRKNYVLGLQRSFGVGKTPHVHNFDCKGECITMLKTESGYSGCPIRIEAARSQIKTPMLAATTAPRETVTDKPLFELDDEIDSLVMVRSGPATS